MSDYGGLSRQPNCLAFIKEDNPEEKKERLPRCVSVRRGKWQEKLSRNKRILGSIKNCAHSDATMI